MLPPKAELPAWPPGHGNLAQLIREYDWARTTLGSADTWTGAHKAAVEVMLESPVAMAQLWGRDGVMIYNDAYALIAGEHHPGSLGAKVAEEWAEIADFNRHVLDVVLAGGTLTYRDQSLILERHGSPEEACFDLYYSPIRGGNDPAGVLAVVIETTQRITAEKLREQAETALRKNEERQRLALEAAYAFGAWDWDVPNDRFTADERFGQLFLLTSDQAREGVPLNEVLAAIHPDDLERVRRSIRTVLRAGGPYAEEYRVLQADGRVRWMSVRGHVEKDQNGEPIRFPGVGVDITKEREARYALQESEEFTRSILASTPDCIKVLDLKGKILSINEGGLKQMEIEDISSVLGRPWPQLWLGEGRVAALKAVAEAQAGRPSRFEGFCETPKHTPKWWEVIVTPILDNDANPARILAVSRDMTDRRRIEEQMRQTARLESLGVMAGGIAHDFNNLLTGILGNASLLAEALPPEESFIAEQIVGAADRAAHLTKQMLAYSGRGRFIVERMNLAQQVREILPLIKPLIEKTAVIEMQLDDTIPDVEADTGQLQQVIMNLVINAAESLNGRPGTVTLTTAVVEAGAGFQAQTFTDAVIVPGPYVCFAVRDTGCGMSAETKHRIFDPFFTTKFTGRGLGLSAVAGIVRGHKGAIRIGSEPGAGTLFEIFLPVAASRQESVEEPHQSDAVKVGTVLFVDDEEIVRNFGKKALERAGFDVKLAADGEEAIQIFSGAAHEIDLVVLDMMMPVMGGEAAYHQVRAVNRDVPVIISSGYNQVEVIRRFTSSREAGFIQKPYTAAQLVAAISQHLRQPHEV